MPNRIIKESIKRSPEIDRLNWFEEVVFYRLIVTADDYGRLDGRTVVLKNDLFPTKETVTKKSIEDALSKLTSVGLLVPYVDAASGMPYYYLPTWKEHQRIRDSKARYPEPPDENGLAATRGNSPQLAATRGNSPLARAESESNPNPNQNPNHDARAEKRRGKADRSPQSNPALNYAQREYKAEDFGDDFFIDLDKYGEGT